MSKLFKSRRSTSNKTSTKSESFKKPKISVKTKLVNKTAHWNYTKLTRYFMIFGVLLALVTSYFWYTKVYMTPERRFWIAINNSMATPSVVRTLNEGGTGNSVVQQYRFNFAPQRVVQNKVEYTEKSATTDTSVTTEGIIYPTEQFLRYTQFNNSRADGIDSGSLDSVLGAWAIQTPEDVEEAKLNYLSEQVSLVIFGNYGANVRNEIINEMKNSNVYGDRLNDALLDEKNDNSVYIYSVNVNIRKYAEILNSAFVKAGYGEFAPLDPSNYREDSNVVGTILISARTNSVVGVSFGGREENYENYGVTGNVDRPESELTVEELQQQVQQLLSVSQ